MKRARHNPAEILKFRVPEASGASPDWNPLQALLEYADKLVRENDQLKASAAAALHTADKRMAEFATGVARRAQTATKATGAILALGLRGGEIVCVGRSGAAPELGARLDPAGGISGRCVRSGEPQLCRDTFTDPWVDASVCTELGIRSLAMAPLHHHGEVFGLLGVFSDKPDHFDQDDLGTLRRLEQVVAEALQQHSDVAPEPKRAIPNPAPPQQQPQARTAPQLVPAVRDGSREVARQQNVTTVSPPQIVPQQKNRGLRHRSMLVFTVGVALVILAALWALAVRPSSPQKVQPPNDAAAPVQSSVPPPAQGVPKPAADGLTRLHGIEYWTAAGMSRVTLLLDGPVEYSAHRLRHPERIYFDLRGARILPGMTRPAVEPGGLVKQVRVAAYEADTVRVVLDLKGAYVYNVAPLSNPPRLRIEIFDSLR